MTAVLTLSYTFYCDEFECGSTLHLRDIKSRATQVAKGQGWTIARDNRHFCPSHPRKRGRRPVTEQSGVSA